MIVSYITCLPILLLYNIVVVIIIIYQLALGHGNLVHSMGLLEYLDGHAQLVHLKLVSN